MQSWVMISQEQKINKGFEVIELLSPLPNNKDDFLNYLKGQQLEHLKNHFYAYSAIPSALRPKIKGVPSFMIIDKEGVIKPSPRNIATAFKILKILRK